MTTNQNSYSLVGGLFILVIVGLLSFVGWFVWHTKQVTNNLASTSQSSQTTPSKLQQPLTTKPSTVTQNNPPNSSTTSSTITGKIVRASGPDPRSGNSQSQSIPASGDSVEFFDQQGAKVATATSASDGGFSVKLPANTYTIKEDVCGVEQTVTTKGISTTTVTLTIPSSC